VSLWGRGTHRLSQVGISLQRGPLMEGHIEFVVALRSNTRGWGATPDRLAHCPEFGRLAGVRPGTVRKAPEALAGLSSGIWRRGLTPWLATTRFSGASGQPGIFTCRSQQRQLCHLLGWLLSVARLTQRRPGPPVPRRGSRPGRRRALLRRCSARSVGRVGHRHSSAAAAVTA
jgi:hypothetical protein